MNIHSLLTSLLIIYFILNPTTVKAQIKEEKISNNQLIDFNIGTENYGIALNLDNPLTRKLDKKLLSVDMQTKFQTMLDNWLQLTNETKN